MKDTLTIPKTLKIGFQARPDTYTGKLAYVVYIDSKGKLRKEGSWEGWRDKKIPVEDLDNTPMSGFVLNRDVGGARGSYSWNVRVEKVRVYDPRGFEFEISIPNLLFILQECSAIKGKGLEGEFVYAWSGPELVLLPTSAQEYKTSLDYGILQTEKVLKTDMEVGCSYLTKKKETVVYMGQYAWWGMPSTYAPESSKAGKKKHVFAVLVPEGAAKYNEERAYLLDDGFTKLAKKIGPYPLYPELHTKLLKSCLVSKPARLLTEPCKLKPRPDGSTYYGWYGYAGAILVNGSLVIGSVREKSAYNQWGHTPNTSTKTLSFDNCESIHIADGKIVKLPVSYSKTFASIDEAKELCKSLVVECENGAKSTIINCTFT